MTIKILSATIYSGYPGADEIILELDIPSGQYPYTGHADAKIIVACGSGEDYCRKHFTDLIPKVINVQSLQLRMGNN